MLRLYAGQSKAPPRLPQTLYPYKSGSGAGLILETLRVASAFAISNQETFIEKVRFASLIREAVMETKRKLNREKKEDR